MKLTRKRGTKNTYRLPSGWFVTAFGHSSVYGSPSGKTVFAVHALNCSAS
jgi:hypothetical protein